GGGASTPKGGGQVLRCESVVGRAGRCLVRLRCHPYRWRGGGGVAQAGGTPGGGRRVLPRPGTVVRGSGRLGSRCRRGRSGTATGVGSGAGPPGAGPAGRGGLGSGAGPGGLSVARPGLCSADRER